MIRDTWTGTKRPKLKEAKIPLRAPIHPLGKNERRAEINIFNSFKSNKSRVMTLPSRIRSEKIPEREYHMIMIITIIILITIL